ncbi:PREDICTED: uncharacterized protein LOC106122437 isoform X1 [Papilio xuthus]|uniref:Uncharacterized protein LOC106122437 isoform X1 n=1 Tax=Papilio xuthus TaxID=66420 RepID=A0AAJ6ZJU2_PAPXU|nr:PREDICTED: uncharacterized protein LOC106122437 isoform X1 [Papilio xuthus]
MVERSVLIFTSLFLILFGAVTSNLHVELTVDPPVVIRDIPIKLICSRNIEDEMVYTVKWIRGTHEFFRYTPGDKHPFKQFVIPGLSIQSNESNGTHVLVKFFEHELSGNFSCEVTSESSFNTKNDTKFIEVISLPPYDPILKTNMDSYKPGDELIANCTTGPAKPIPNITIFVNDEPLRPLSTTWLSSYDRARAVVKIKLTPAHFSAGLLRLSCRATIYDVYARRRNMDFFAPNNGPRPERITHNSGASTCFINWFLMLILLFLPMVLCQDYEDLLETAPSDAFQYYDESEMNAMMSAIGG